MAQRDLSETGVVRVNGQWATSIQYEAERAGDRISALALRFMQTHAEVARATLTRAQALERLGERNVAAIEQQVGLANPQETKVKGELSGPQLSYREVSIDGAASQDPGNTFAQGRRRAVEAAPEATAARQGAGAAASGVSASGGGGPAVQAAAGAVQGAGVDRVVRPRDEDQQRGGVAHATAERDPRAMPGHVAAKFLRNGDKYYFDDQRLAFVDLGSTLRAETENRSVIKDLVDIAKARGWEEGVVRGTENFRREVWKEAHAQGIRVEGYTPTPIEREAAQARQSGGADGAPEADQAARGGAARQPLSPADGVVYGKLLEHGEAPYQFDRRNDPSYFVKLEGPDGRTRVWWGLGLQAALRDSQTQAAIGDPVGIREVGQRSVLVSGRRVDPQSGEVIEIKTPAQRKEWAVEKAAYFADPERLARDVQARREKAHAAHTRFESFIDRPAGDRAAAVGGEARAVAAQREQAARNARTTRDELQRRSPEVAAAVFSTTRAREQFVDAFVKAGLVRPNDREDVMRLFEAAAEKRGMEKFSAKDFERTLRNAVYQAADEVGRTPIAAQPVQTPKALVREDAHVRA